MRRRKPDHNARAVMHAGGGGAVWQSEKDHETQSRKESGCPVSAYDDDAYNQGIGAKPGARYIVVTRQFLTLES